MFVENTRKLTGSPLVSGAKSMLVDVVCWRIPLLAITV